MRVLQAPPAPLAAARPRCASVARPASACVSRRPTPQRLLQPASQLLRAQPRSRHVWQRAAPRAAWSTNKVEVEALPEAVRERTVTAVEALGARAACAPPCVASEGAHALTRLQVAASPPATSPRAQA